MLININHKQFVPNNEYYKRKSIEGLEEWTLKPPKNQKNRINIQGYTYEVYTKRITHSEFGWKFIRGLAAFAATFFSLGSAYFFSKTVRHLWNQSIAGEEIRKIKVLEKINNSENKINQIGNTVISPSNSSLNPLDNLSPIESVQAKEPNPTLDDQKTENAKTKASLQNNKNINTQTNWSFISSFNATKHGIPTQSPNLKNHIAKFPNSLGEKIPIGNYFGMFFVTCRTDFQEHVERFKKFLKECDKTLPVYILIFRYGDNIDLSFTNNLNTEMIDINNDNLDVKIFNNKDQIDWQAYPILNLRFTNKGILEDDINRDLIEKFRNNQNIN